MERYARTWLNDADWLAEIPPRLPGMSPLDPSEWLIRDEAFAHQMAERDRLVAEQPGAVLAQTYEAREAIAECLDLVMATLRTDPDYSVEDDVITRPDGVPITLDPRARLRTLARLVQSDICIMQEHGDEHRLTAAALCFPASWTLSEKIGRPLMAIHGPVEIYDEHLGKRVQRLFDAIRPERPLQRANALLYASDRLHHPKTEGAPHERPLGDDGFLRSERQTLRRLPQTGAVVFGIHTRLVPAQELPDRIRRALRRRYAYSE